MNASADWLVLLVLGPVVLGLAVAWGIFVARRGGASAEDRRRRDDATRTLYRDGTDNT